MEQTPDRDVLYIPMEASPLSSIPDGLPPTPGKEAEKILRRIARMEELFGKSPTPTRVPVSSIQTEGAANTPKGIHLRDVDTPGGEGNRCATDDLLVLVPTHLRNGGTKKYRLRCNNGRVIKIKVDKDIQRL